jgi:hypothetical protein
MIRHEDGKWTLYSHEGKSLGSYDTKEECEERERQVQAFKHMKETFGFGDALCSSVLAMAREAATDPGFFEHCMKDIAPKSGVSDPEAFCAWLHQQVLGTWPGEHRAKEDGGRLLEALEPTGKTWRVRVLRFGRSMNGWLWTPEAGQALVGHLDGAPVGLYHYPNGSAHADEAAIHAAQGPVVRNIVGDLSHPAVETDGVYADLHLHEDVPWLKTKLLGLSQRGMLGKVLGLSVDTLASYAPVQLKEGAARAIKSITRLMSVDIVGSPSADGRFIAVKEAEMKSDQLLTLVREHRPSLLDGKDTTTLTDDDLAGLVKEALSTPPTPPPGPSPASASHASGNGADPMAAMVARANQLNEEFALRVSSLRVQEKIGSSGLPEYAQARLKQRFHGRIVEEDELDNEIKGERDYLAKVSESGTPKGFGATRAEVVSAPRDKIQAALDALFGIKEDSFMRAIEANGPFSEDAIGRIRESFAPHREAAKDPGLKFRGLRDFYTHMTGDIDVTGKMPPGGRVSEVVLSSTWADVLGNTLYRTLLATYAETQYQERTIARYGRAVDFRNRETVLLGYFPDLSNVAENGAYTAIADPGDDKVTYAVAKRGNLFSVTLETIKNDDMRVVAESVRRLGRAARRTLATFIWTFWNGAGAAYDPDTLTWFHATHANTATTVLTADMAGADAVYAKIAQLANMTESPPTGSTAKLGFPPTESLWLDVPIALAGVARKLVTAPEFGAGNTNTIYSMFGNPNRDPEGAIRVNANVLFTDATDWGIHVNPNTGGRESIWVDFLDGNEEPEMFLADMPTQGALFTNDRIEWKIRHIYGGDLVDYRGAAKSIAA